MEWNKLVEEYYRPIYSFCAHMLSNSQDAEDVCQQTFLKAHRARKSLKDTKKAKAWLYTIARNCCRDKYRSKAKRGKSVELTEELDSVDSQSELSLILRQEIQSLPQRQREVFILRHWHGFSTADTAGLLKISQGAVKSHLKRSVDTLKARLTEQMTTDPAEAQSDINEERI